MTRKDAQMIAEELAKLLDGKFSSVIEKKNEEWLNTKEAAMYMRVSVGYVKKYIDEIPHVKVGRINKFQKSALYNYLNR